MKVLLKALGDLALAGRWDIDFHLPAVEIAKFPKEQIFKISDVADIRKAKRDPGKNPDELFQYIDIASIDVASGIVTNPQELRGDEAPSRARKVVSAFDIVISTCRPTRGAIAVVPLALHNQIASTAFSIVQAKKGVNPFYLYYALRLPSTLEQFRKWSTGSSYPAILDEDVKKTRIPVPSPEIQDQIAFKVLSALSERDLALSRANQQWNSVLENIGDALKGKSPLTAAPAKSIDQVFSISDIYRTLSDLPALTVDGRPSIADLFDEMLTEE